MRTISRLIRRCILSAFGIVLMVFTVNAALFLGLILYFGARQQNSWFPIESFASSFSPKPDGSIQPELDVDWQDRFAWAMLLDHGGEIIWSQAVPEELNRSYTVPEAASFSRWYLRDYPVMVYRNDYGLLVAGRPIGSMTRFNLYMENDILGALLAGFIPLLLLDAGLVLFACLLLGWRGAAPLRRLGRGIELLAEGTPVELKVSGATAELAEKVNQASRRLSRQAARIQERDAARTDWIAGVSHDIRTPLALIMGYAQQLEELYPDHSEQKHKAVSIRLQSQKIKTLIEDLNLTSKLQYNAQPLRMRTVQAGVMLRGCIAAFCDGLGDAYTFDLAISDTADRLTLQLDDELMTRAIDNLLHNCVRHNPDGCSIALRADWADSRFRLMIRDNGAGYPGSILARLAVCRPQSESNAPHILGLLLVRQIVEAHGGTVAFCNDNGAVAEIILRTM